MRVSSKKMKSQLKLKKAMINIQKFLARNNIVIGVVGNKIALMDVGTKSTYFVRTEKEVDPNEAGL